MFDLLLPGITQPQEQRELWTAKQRDTARILTFCNSKVEDEIHMLLDCSIQNGIGLLRLICTWKRAFTNMMVVNFLGEKTKVVNAWCGCKYVRHFIQMKWLLVIVIPKVLFDGMYVRSTLWWTCIFGCKGKAFMTSYRDTVMTIWEKCLHY